jgi:hypothetical protein
MGMITGWLGLAGRGYYDAFVAHPKIETAFDRWENGSFFRDDLRSRGFTYQDVLWQEYHGSIGGVDFIDSDEAYLIPLGVQDLFIVRNAPADYMETVNTTGLPYYAKQAMRRFDIRAARVVHRVGPLRVGDQIVLVAVSSAHRGQAFQACEFLMDYLKTQAPFWKKEETAEGERWVEARASDDAAAARWVER